MNATNKGRCNLIDDSIRGDRETGPFLWKADSCDPGKVRLINVPYRHLNQGLPVRLDLHFRYQSGRIFDEVNISSVTSIILFFRYDSSYSTTRVGHITMIAGNQMEVQVHYGLSGGGSAVDSQIVSIRHEVGVHQIPSLMKQVVDSPFFFSGAFPKISYMAISNDQYMAGSDGEFVISCPGQIICQDYFFWVTERTNFHICRSLCL